MKTAKVLVLQAMMVFSNFAMMTNYDFYSEDCSRGFQLFEGEIDQIVHIDHAINEEKLASIVKDTVKVAVKSSKERLQPKRLKIRTISLQNAVENLHVYITKSDFEGTCRMFEQLEENYMFAAKLMGVRYGSIISVDHFYEGLIDIPINGIQLAKECAKLGNNKLFLRNLQYYRAEIQKTDLDI